MEINTATVSNVSLAKYNIEVFFFTLLALANDGSFYSGLTTCELTRVFNFLET